MLPKGGGDGIAGNYRAMDAAGTGMEGRRGIIYFFIFLLGPKRCRIGPN